MKKGSKIHRKKENRASAKAAKLEKVKRLRRARNVRFEKKSSSEKYHIAVERIKAKMGRYNPKSVVQQTILYLSNSNRLNDPILGLPWIVMLAFKLSMLNASPKERDILKEEYELILNSLYEIQHLACSIPEGEVHLKMRSMVVQQAWYQQSEKNNLLKLLRQAYLLTNGNQYYEEKFSNSHGISILNYYVISVYLVLAVGKEKNNIAEIKLPTLIKDLHPFVSVNEIGNYIKLTGLPLDDLVKFFEKSKMKYEYNQQSEYFQPTPVRKRPLLIDGKSIFILSKTILSGGLASIVIDDLKEKHEQEFKKVLGKDFESYVGNIIKDSGFDSLDENGIVELFKKNSIKRKKITDFLIEREKPILVECKAIEPGDIVKSSFEPDLLFKMLEQSYIKAIQQGQETAEGLKKTKRYKDKEFLHIVVTNEEFWFATAEDMKFLKKDINLGVGDSGEEVIDPSKIFFISIECFESIFELHKTGMIDIGKTLERCAEKMKEPHGYRMTMSSAISEEVSGSALNVRLKEASTELLDNIANIIAENNEFWDKLSDKSSFENVCGNVYSNVESYFENKVDW